MTTGPGHLEVHASVESIASEWDALADATGAAPFARPGWYAAWLGAFAGRARFELLALRRGPTLVAVLPLLARHGRLRSPTNWHTPAYPVLAADDAAADEILAQLFRLRRWNVTLSFLDPPTAERARGVASRCGCRVSSHVLLETPYVHLGTVTERTDPKSRRVLARRRRRLEEQGRVNVRVHSGDQRLDEMMQVWFQIEASSWKGRQGDDVLSRTETTRFYLEIARWAASRKSLLLAFLCLDERPIAFQFALDDQSRWHFLKTGYDEQLRSFGPGKLLMAELLDQARAAGREEVNLGGAADPYKLEWTDLVRPYVELQVFAPSMTGVAAHVADVHLRPVAGMLLRGARAAASRLAFPWSRGPRRYSQNSPPPPDAA